MEQKIVWMILMTLSLVWIWRVAFRAPTVPQTRTDLHITLDELDIQEFSVCTKFDQAAIATLRAHALDCEQCRVYLPTIDEIDRKIQRRMVFRPQALSKLT